MNQKVLKFGLLLALSLTMCGAAMAGSEATGTVRIGVTLVIPLQANQVRKPQSVNVFMGDGAVLSIPHHPVVEHLRMERKIPLLPPGKTERIWQDATKPADSAVLVSDTFVAE